MRNPLGTARPLPTILASMALFGASTPLAKLLVGGTGPVVLAGLLYLGAFAGMAVVTMAVLAARGTSAAVGEIPRLRRQDVPWLAGATVSGGIIAPIALMAGLERTTGFTASLLLNLEGVATALIAALVFAEHTGPRLWGALACMTAGGVLLSWDPSSGGFSLAGPALLVVAGAGWGVDNNLTRRISDRDPVQIAMVKGLVAGSVSLALGLVLGTGMPSGPGVLYALLLGALGYGASLVLFVRALRAMGASRTGAFFSMAPFVGAGVSLAVLRESLVWAMLPATALMVAGTALIVLERHSHPHAHELTVHTHEHVHGDLHHGHSHPPGTPEPHTHGHVHATVVHEHPHWPDTHHRHGHG
jgi:drug/metabolite transporter (DMT)-like permease